MKAKYIGSPSNKILRIINRSQHPLGTKEIGNRLGVSWDTVDIKLKILHGSGQIEGRKILGGKGVWIWWRKDAFVNPR
jgi:predicted transcriptional regulator